MHFSLIDALPMLTGLAASVILAFAAGLAYFAVSRKGGSRAAWYCLASVIVAFAPALVPVACGAVRMFATFISIAILLKLYDRFRGPALGDVPSTWLSDAAFLANWFWLVQSKPPAAVPATDDRSRLAWLLPQSIACLAISAIVFLHDWATSPFWVEHLMKAAVLGITVPLSTNCLAVVWRLCGAHALDPMMAPWLARTPLDTWRRWNRPTQQFLHEHLFLPAGGAKRPVCAILWTFFVSGLIHEYVFAIATGRPQGWQLLFFSLQGVAAAITIRVRPRGGWIVPAVAATLAFNLATLAIFGISVQQVVPFYSQRNP